MTVETPAPLEKFHAPYAPPDEEFRAQFLACAVSPEERARESSVARELLRDLRANGGGLGGVEDFLHEFKLSSREGLAVMTLAEALIRAPDNPTADLLLADKLAAGDFAHHKTASDALLVQACAFALGFSARLHRAGISAQGKAADLARRLGAPVLRTAARRAMALLGGHFVFGETIQAALARAENTE